MLTDLVKKNRSYRGFDESCPVTEEQLLALVELSRWTPSGANAQPLKYHIVWEKEETEGLLALTRWAAALPQLKLPREGKHPTAFIVILQDLSIVSKPGAADKDVGIAAQTMMLGAAEAGLGGCMIANFDHERVRAFLKTEEKLEPVLILALGKPAEEIRVVPLEKGQKTAYWRDEADIHYVPKRRTEDILV